MFTPLPNIRVAELLAQGEELDSFPRDGILVTDPQVINETLGALIRHGTQAELTQGDLRIRLDPVVYSPDLDLMQWDVGQAQVGSGPCSLTLLGYNALFRFRVAQALQHGRKLTTPVPCEIFKIRQRWQRRQLTDDLVVECEFPGGKKVERKVRDISYGGLAMFHEDDGEHLLLEGETILASLRNAAGATVKIQATVVEFSTQAGVGLCHLHIPSLRGRREGWVDLVNDRLHPGTKTGSEYNADVWDLYTECGYFNLSGKTPADFERMQRGYYSAAAQLDRAPQLGCQVVWPNSAGQAGVNAALSMLKVYSHTWFGFQMARVSGDTSDGIAGRRVLREIHLRAYEHAQQDPDLRWTMAYTQVKKVWSRLLHHDLPERFIEAGEASIVRFRALQYEVGDLNVPARQGLLIDRPSGDELHEIALSIKASRSEVYCDALDLVPERMSMSQIRKQFARSQLGRDRLFFVARYKGRAMAAAVCEMASDGLHVFGLLDLVRLYALSEDGEDYFCELLTQCATWYREKGKGSFCLYLEDGQSLEDATQETATDMGLADMVIFSAERLPEFFEYLHELTSPRTKSIDISQPKPQ